MDVLKFGPFCTVNQSNFLKIIIVDKEDADLGEYFRWSSLLDS